MPAGKRPPLVIAHRGASGYLPEHTLAAKALAFGLGADFLEQDVVATGDDCLVVLHDIHLDRVTDVAERFPSRHREDGRFYARDFDLAELRTLNVHERRHADGSAVFPGRFPTRLGRFGITTLAEEIEMIRGLAQSTGRVAGIYPEIKAPAWHREEGADLSRLVLRELERQGFAESGDPVYLQCFDAFELRRIREELGSDLKLVQLIAASGSRGTEADFDQLATADGLRQVAAYADAIGPALEDLYGFADIDGHAVSSGLVSAAHAAGLLVHPYTFRADALPPGFAGFGELVEWFAVTLGIDGLFTDFPDLAALALRRPGDAAS
ncbi:MAG: glycerophosphodiester phosphodiesterase [Woeseia sp.]